MSPSSFHPFTRRSMAPAAAASSLAVAAAATAFFNTPTTENGRNTERNPEDSTLAVAAIVGAKSVKIGWHSVSCPLLLLPSKSSWSRVEGFSILKLLAGSSVLLSPQVTLCEAARPSLIRNNQTIDPIGEDKNLAKLENGERSGEMDEEGSYHGLFPRRQLWRPRLEYPLWDYNWDGRQPPPLDDKDNETTFSSTSVKDTASNNRKMSAEEQRERYIRKHGVTRHIILIRHGQYDETSSEDSKRILTPLGRRQAQLTGKRLGELIRGGDMGIEEQQQQQQSQFGPCRVKIVRVSDLTRAKETADIIFENMMVIEKDNRDKKTMMIEKADPDPLLNEGRPCHHIPGGKARESIIKSIDHQQPRIEHAFQKYFYRADIPSFPVLEDAAPHANEKKDALPSLKINTTDIVEPIQHEFEIIVCHANVIRYFFCRALQLPPEAWLRLCIFNCSLTYFTIRPTGTISCRMLGDIGHLPYDASTFSMHLGFNW